MPDDKSFFQDVIKVEHNGENFEFRIPSVKDRQKIYSAAAKMRRETDPDGIGISYGYDPSALNYFEYIATFVTLLNTTDAKWVYSVDEKGQPKLDTSRWGDDAPILEVVDKFNKELALFRNRGH